MCKDRGEEEVLIKHGPEEQVIEVETADVDVDVQSGISIAGIVLLAILLLITFVTGAYVIIQYVEADLGARRE
ncbi:hypothetical protein MRX96_025114 [Rhipicephalus microplus]